MNHKEENLDTHLERPSLPRLKIGKYESELPIIQGGMGIGISTHLLAGTVSREGGIGTLSSAGLCMTPPYIHLFREAVQKEKEQLGGELGEGDLERIFLATNRECIKLEIQKSREICGNKPLFINVMNAVNDDGGQVRAACEAGISGIVMGAGLPFDLPKITKDFPDVALIPILSSARGVNIILQKWKRHGRAPDAIILEDPSKAGGHLGSKNRASIDNEETRLEISVPATRQLLDDAGLHHVPIIAAGGIVTREDIDRMMSPDVRASAVQMGTRFLATPESGAHPDFKQAILDAGPDDIVTYISNALLPARALKKSSILAKLSGIKVEVRKCVYNCLKHCGYRDGIGGSDEERVAQMCILMELIKSVEGASGDGLMFTGVSATRINTIKSVEQILDELR